MKLKQTLLVAALLATAGISNAAVTKTDLNLAVGKEAFASSLNGAHVPSAAVDGITTGESRWESSVADNQWFYVDLGEKQKLDHVRIYWEAAFSSQYSLYVADELTDAMLANLSDGDSANDFAAGWTKVIDVTNENYDAIKDGNDVQEIGKEGRYVAINCLKRGTIYGNSFYEFKVYDGPYEFTYSEPILSVTPDIRAGYVGTTVNFLAEGFNTDGSPIDLSDAVWTMNDEPMASQTVTFDTKGFYTVKVVAKNGAEGETFVGIFDTADNFVTPSLLTQQSDNTTADASNAIDGDAGTMWAAEASGAKDFDAWMVVNLGSELDVNGCYLHWEGATSAEYTVEVSTDGVEYTPVFSYASDVKMQDRYDWVFDGKSHKARFVKIHSTKANTQWGVKLKELQIFAEGTLAPAVFSSLELTVDNVVNKFGTTTTNYNLSCDAFDQYGNAWELSEEELASLQWTVTPAETASIENNVLTVTAIDNYTVTCSLDGVVSNPIEVNVVSSSSNIIEDNENVTATACESTDEANPANFAIDGNTGSMWIVPDQTGTDLVYDAWIQIDLGKVYDIDCVNVLWEASCPADYKVIVSETGNDDSVVYGERMGNVSVPGTDLDDWFYGKVVKGRFVKVYSTKAALPYGIKMKELYIYGKEVTSSSVSSLLESGVRVQLAGDVLRFSAEANAVVYNMNGVAVATANGVSEMNVSSLPSGVYVVKAVDMNGNVATVKVVK